MKREYVESSSLETIGYDADSETLEVEFRTDGVYQYHGVPASVYREFMEADSKGRFLNLRIKEVYPFTRV